MSMFSTLIKKKLSDNQVANIFINAIFDCVDKGFCEVAALINEDPVFVKSPNISENASGEFGLIIIVLSESSSGYVSNTYLENIKFILIPLSILLFLYISFIYQLKFKFKNLL